MFQEIINIYFKDHRSQLKYLPCRRNFRRTQCGRGHCRDSKLTTDGISVLHGTVRSFTPTGPVPIFRAIFQVFERAKLNSNFSLKHFVENLDSELRMTIELYPRSTCAKNPGFREIILKPLENILTGSAGNNELTTRTMKTKFKLFYK